MEKITVFKLSDGRLVESESLAIACQQEIDIKNKLNILCEKYLSIENPDNFAEILYTKRHEFVNAFANKDLV